MDPYMSPACPLFEHLKWMHMRIKLFPLAAPVGSNLVLPDDTPAFSDALGQLTLSLMRANAPSMFRWLKAE
jgi:hypothetical protein